MDAAPARRPTATSVYAAGQRVEPRGARVTPDPHLVHCETASQPRRHCTACAGRSGLALSRDRNGARCDDHGTATGDPFPVGSHVVYPRPPETWVSHGSGPSNYGMEPPAFGRG